MIPIPQVGLGLWQVTDKEEFNRMFSAAIKAGYRHFDTAQQYKNEQFLGECIAKSGIPREDFFITTKIAVGNFGYSRAIKTFEASLKKLRTNYVDLLLLHFPVPILRRKTWKVLEEAKERGKTKIIGVSNYTTRHLTEMKKYALTMPEVNQVELHVFLQQPQLLSYCKKNNIRVEAYSPLAHGRGLNDSTLEKIAKQHGKSTAQIMLRWCLQIDTIPLPKSTSPNRIVENIDIFDFKLSNDNMKELTKLNKGMRTCWDPTLVP